MEEKKVANSERIRLRRTMELREFALAAFYPLTHSGNAAHLKRTEDALPMIPAHPLLNRLTPQVERLLRLEREHGHQRCPDEPKPWKKPWDK